MTGVRSPTLGGVEIWRFIHPRWSPRVRLFHNQSQLDEFCRKPTLLDTNPGNANALPCPNKLLAMNGTSLWLSRGAGFNIGHALLDELFSVYMSCLKLGVCRELAYSVTPTLRPVVMPGSLQMDLGLRPESVIARFCGHPVVSSKHFDGSIMYQFESMIVGHGHLGMSSIDRNYCSPGQRSRGYSVDAMKSFRNRMYAAYSVAAPTVVPAWRDAPPPTIHNSTASPPSKSELFSPTAWQRKLRVLVIANKRTFYPDLRQATELLQSAGLDARLVEFPLPFQRQLEMLREADIVLSGVGTSLLAAVFLSDGATVVNLGTSEKSCAWSYMEEFLLCGTDWVRIVYNRVPNFAVRHVFALFEEAAANYNMTARGRFALPVPIEQSLSPIGRAVREYFQHDIRMWLALVGDSIPGGGDACLGWGERFVCSPWQFEAHGCIPHGAINMAVLAALRQKHNIQCQCV